jgi:ParB family chromosome partitioning protein
MSEEKKKALGKGLEALLPGRPALAASARPPAPGTETIPWQTLKPHAWPPNSGAPAPLLTPRPAAAPAGRQWSPELLEETKIQAGDMVIEIPLTLLGRNPYQTRITRADDPSLAELAESIKAHGVMQPIVVRPRKPAGPQGELYELIAGERRWRASQQAGRTHIPAIVRDVPDELVLVLTIVENLHREDLNPMQNARALQRLAAEFRLTQEEVAARTGLSRSAVANFLRLVRLPDELQAAVADGHLGFGQVKVLMAVTDPDQIGLLARKVMAGKLTVRETEALMQNFLHPPATEPRAQPAPDPNVRAAEMQLQRALGCRVRVKDHNGRGKIVIEYNSLEDFDRILETLK